MTTAAVAMPHFLCSEFHAIRASGYQTKQSLVYDLQEPFRWIADVTVIEGFQSQVLDLPDFYFTGDDYRYRFEPEAKGRFLGLLRERFNSGVTYKTHAFEWDTIIEQKTVELGRFLIDRSARLDFMDPTPSLQRIDDRELRKRILSLSQREARDLGIERSTLHYLRRCARNGPTFRLHAKTLSRVEMVGSQ
jgi:CRISPR-associated protein Cas1